MDDEICIANFLRYSFRPVNVWSVYEIDKNYNKRLKKTLLKKNLVYYNGRFYPMNCFVFSDGQVQLADYVKENPDKYCLQHHYIYIRFFLLTLIKYVVKSIREKKNAPRRDYGFDRRMYAFAAEDYGVSQSIYTVRHNLDIGEKMESFDKALNEMPNTLGDALRYIRKDLGFNHADFEALSGADVRTIRRIEANTIQPKLKTIVAICVSLHLFPYFSQELLERAGYSLKYPRTETEKAYKGLLQLCFDASFEECNNYLREKGLDPLSLNEVYEIEDIIKNKG